jgi:hypothetical protein
MFILTFLLTIIYNITYKSVNISSWITLYVAQNTTQYTYASRNRMYKRHISYWNAIFFNIFPLHFHRDAKYSVNLDRTGNIRS